MIAENNRIRKEELKKWNDNINLQINEIREANAQSASERAQLNGRISQAQEIILAQDSSRKELQKQRDKDYEDFQSRQKNASRFFHDYQILSNTIVAKDDDGKYKYATELMFYWLIRIIFFLIELLPTLVKVITPVGAYDRLAYDEERALKEYFSSADYYDAIHELQQNKMQHDSDMQQEQLSIDRETKLEIMKKVIQTQRELADEALKRWKDTEIEKMSVAHKTDPVVNDSTTDDESFISMA